MKLKLKYFIRGLGVGILFTAIVMSISLQASRSKIIKDHAMTKEQIIEKARTYGMVLEKDDMTESIQDSSESKDGEAVDNTNSDASSNNDSSEGENVETDQTVQEDTTKEDNLENADAASEDDTKEVQSESSDSEVKDNEQKPDHSKESDSGKSKDSSIITIDYKNIEITSGMNAYEVAELLHEQGLVEEIKDFQDYLVDNNSQKYIITGKYLIPMDADYSEITRIITKNKSN